MAGTPNYKGLIQEGKTLLLSLSKYKQRFENRKYDDEAITDFKNMVETVDTLETSYKQKVQQKEILTEGVRKMVTAAKSAYNKIKEGAQDAFPDNAKEQKALGKGVRLSTNPGNLASQLELLSKNAVPRKQKLINKGGSLESEINALFPLATALRNKAAEHKQAKGISPKEYKDLIEKAEALQDECDRIYRIAKREFADELQIYKEIYKAKEQRKTFGGGGEEPPQKPPTPPPQK